MDTDTAGVAVVTGHDKRSDKPRTSSDSNRNKNLLASRPPPSGLFAPPEYLQSQRRGSIADSPSHASPKLQSKTSNPPPSLNPHPRGLPSGRHPGSPQVVAQTSVQSTGSKKVSAGNGIARKGTTLEGAKRGGGSEPASQLHIRLLLFNQCSQRPKRQKTPITWTSTA
jgi:hypothetical protein